jgi:hypothetical protein
MFTVGVAAWIRIFIRGLMLIRQVLTAEEMARHVEFL